MNGQPLTEEEVNEIRRRGRMAEPRPEYYKQMEKKYRIIENKYFDSYGVEHSLGYNVQMRKSFLGITYWKTYKKAVCGYDGIDYEPIQFNKLEKAEEFIKEKLCTGTPRDKHKTKVIGEYGC